MLRILSILLLSLLTCIGSDPRPFTFSDQAFLQAALPSISPYTNIVKALNPIAYWPLNETSGTTVYDAMGSYNGTYYSVTINNNTFATDGYPVPAFGASSRAHMYSVGLSNIWPSESCTIMVWAKITNYTYLVDTTAKWALSFRGSTVDDRISFLKDANPYVWTWYYFVGGVEKYATRYYGSTNWINVAITWDRTAGKEICYWNGLPFLTNNATRSWTNGLVSTYAEIGARDSSGLTPFYGWLGHVALWTNVLTPAQISTLYVPEFPTANGLLCVGDSKTFNDPWPQILANKLTDQTGSKWVDREDIAVGALDVGELTNYLYTTLTSRVDTVSKVCLNIGANDIPEPTPEATFTNQLFFCIQTITNKYPSADLYVAQVWRRAYSNKVTTINGYITNVVAKYGSAKIHLGPNEVVWLENGDDGVAYTSDGVHYKLTEPVQNIVATNWMSAFGY